MNRKLLSLAVVALLGTTLAAQDFQTWSDATGKFKIEAKFVGVENGKAVLEKKDGDRIQIDLTKLSAEDRIKISKLQADAENPFEKVKPSGSKAAGKMESKEGEGKSAPRRRAGSNNEAAEPTVTLNWEDAKAVTSFGAEWKAPKFTAATSDWSPKPMVLPPKADFFESFKGMVVANGSKTIFAYSQLAKPGDQKGESTRLMIGDLANGKFQREIRVPGKYIVLDVTADGKKMLARHDDFFNKRSDVLELWEVEDKAVNLLQSFKGGKPEENAHNRAVASAKFLGEGKSALICLADGNYSLVDLATNKVLFHGKQEGGVVPVIFPDESHFLTLSDKQVVAVDIKSGEVVAAFNPETEHMHNPRLAISPDGKRVALHGGQKIDVFTLENGQKEVSIPVQFGGDHTLFWTGPESLMAGKPLTYYDLGMKYAIWSYEGTDQVLPVGSKVLLFIDENNRRGFVSSPLPHPAATALATQSKNDPNFFIIKPGTKFRVDVSGIAADFKDEAKRKLEEAIAKSGHSVDSSASLVVRAEFAKGKDHEVSYRAFGTSPFREGGPTYTIPGYEYRVKVESGGKVYWETAGGNHPPPMLHMRENETVEQALQKFKTPSAAFYGFVQIPKYVARNTSGSNTGSAIKSSRVTSNGVK